MHMLAKLSTDVVPEFQTLSRQLLVLFLAKQSIAHYNNLLLLYKQPHTHHLRVEVQAFTYIMISSNFLSNVKIIIHIYVPKITNLWYSTL